MPNLKNDPKVIKAWIKTYYGLNKDKSLRDLKRWVNKKCTPRFKSAHIKACGISACSMVFCVHSFILSHWNEFYQMDLKVPTLQQAQGILKRAGYGNLKTSVTEIGLNSVFTTQKERLSRLRDCALSNILVNI